MRTFWTLIAILVIATVGIIVARRTTREPAVPPAPAPPSTSPGRAADAPRAPDAEPTPSLPTPPPHTTVETPVTTPAPAAEREQAMGAPAATTDTRDRPLEPAAQREHEAQPEPVRPSPPPVETPRPKADTPEESPAKPAEHPAETAAAPAAESPKPTDPTPPASLSTSGGPKPRQAASAEAVAAAESTKGPPTLVKQSDGTTLVAGRFVIKGDGTKESPYEVTWEHLMSAQETYKPRIGLKIIPGWLSLIHDKWVKVSGYVAFPVMAQGPDEMLMMLNQWDGCCIGVPPTPYDAIEVKLNKPAEGETRLLIMGTVTGKLKVDPYLVKDWLVSLYIMDEAEVSKQSGAALRDSVKPQEHLAP